MVMKKSTMLFSIFVGVVALLILTTHSVYAAPIEDVPVTVTQPDGTVLNLFASGDEYYNWLHDADGYTIIQDPVTGYYVYADLVDGALVPSQFVVGKADPASTGLSPHLNISPAQKEEIRQEFLNQPSAAAGAIRNAPTTGTLTNLVIFIRFSDESEFTQATSIYTDMLNSSTTGANSLRNYYWEASYNTLTINSTLLPVPGTTIVSYQDGHPRRYYQPYNAVTNPNGYTNDRGPREHTLLRDAINYVAGLGQFPAGTSIDADSDGVVDSLTFVVSGGTDGWNQLLWPHKWLLFTYDVTIKGKAVQEYSFHLNSSLGTGVLAHEMFHVLGAPDLYHYSYDGRQTVGGWDLMEFTANPPEHMGCYMKFRYGHWISTIPELTAPGTYTLNPLTSSTNNCKKIASPYSTTEYFVVEYRNRAGSIFENSLPGNGLLVYRINPTVNGNASGPPDEVYIYRPGGTPTVNGSINLANFSSNVGRTAINDVTNPSSFLSNGSAGGLNICNIGASNSTISFDICTSSRYNISGNAGVSGATLSYTDAGPKTAIADENGMYSFAVPSGWSGTVTPSKTGYTFSPVSRSYTNVIASQTAQDYTATGSSDSYEPDNSPGEAKVIDSDTAQIHSIMPAGDMDWVKFTLNATTAVTLETTGATASDTQMWLYDSNQTELKYSDDEGVGLYSYINLVCGVDALPAGTYYVRVGEYGNDNDIPGYELSLDTVECPSPATLTINKAGTGSGTVTATGISCGTDCSEVYAYNTQVSLTATAATGSTFAGWSGNADCSDGVVTMTTNRSCTATFNSNSYTLTINKAGTGSGTVTATGINCGTDCSESYTYGTQVTLTASPAAGSTFAGWSGNADCSDGVVTMTADRSCTATFNNPIDNYEPDGAADEAKVIQAGSPQTHSIIPVGDVDWVKFTLSATSAVTLETTGATNSDTRMWLYDSSQTELKHSDNEGNGNYSYINLVCKADALPAGTYYVKIDENQNNNEIPFYNLSLNIQTCPVIPNTTGVFRPSNGVIFLKNTHSTGFADVALNYGIPGDYPVVGDWDGDGDATIGVYRNGSFFLRQSNDIGFADIVFPFGQAGDQPVAGDWDGDGIDTIGVYRPSNGQFLLRNSNDAGAADISFFLGNVGDVGIAGDWNGDGLDTTGVFRPVNGIIFLKNTNDTGFADVALNYGIPGDKPVIGDWNGDGTDTIGVYRNGRFFLRNSNTIGFADIVFDLGNPGDMPIAGDWDGLP